MGFMSKTELTVLKAPVSSVPLCGKCGMYRTCASPKMEPSGRGKDILIVGEFPGEDEDLQGTQFAGPSGRILKDVAGGLGVDLRRDCTLTNALICRPRGKEVEDKKKIGYCRPNLLNTIKELKPKVVILLGPIAVESLVGHLWREQVGGIKRWVGHQIPHQKLNAWVCPTYHPSYLAYQKDPVIDRVFADNLKAAFGLPGRPWNRPPDFRKQIEIVLDDGEVARRLGTIKAGTIAFDFESDRLKADHKDAEIVSCSVCFDGEWTIAFPWYGKVVPAMRELLLNPKVGKIASNMKHEERWCRRKLGYRVRNWVWDTMLAAHVLDPRGKISSIKFQAFVRLGTEDYDHNVKEYMKAKGGNEQNRIKEIDLTNLLIYNGLDSLLEYKVAMMQRREFSV